MMQVNKTLNTVFMAWLRSWILIQGCLQTVQTYSCLWLMNICTVVQNCHQTLLFYLKLPHSRSHADWKRRMGRHTPHQKPRVSWPGSKYPTVGSYRGLREPGSKGLHRYTEGNATMGREPEKLSLWPCRLVVLWKAATQPSKRFVIHYPNRKCQTDNKLMMGYHIRKNELDIGKLTRQSLECNKQQTGRTS